MAEVSNPMVRVRSTHGRVACSQALRQPREDEGGQPESGRGFLLANYFLSQYSINSDKDSALCGRPSTLKDGPKMF